MSWVDRVQTEMIIATGDGKRYKPYWMNATKEVEYNIAEFEFPNLEGTRVDRGTPKGRKFSLEIYFQGEDNLEQAEAFELSARDRNPWTIAHPIYGDLVVQPVGLSFDNTSMNTTKITGSVIETIVIDNPRTVINPIDNIGIKSTQISELFAQSFNAIPKAVEINKAKTDLNKLYRMGAKIATLQREGEVYFNLFNKANTALLNATAKPLEAIRALQSAIGQPALFSINAKQRVGLLSSQFKALSVTLPTTYAGKKMYEIQAGTLISAMALAAATPIENDYENRSEVLDVIGELIKNYNLYCGIPDYDNLLNISYLESLQATTGNSPDAFIPDAASIISLNELVNYTVANLFDVALDSKQERSIILEEDSNVIILTHRFYTLDPEDVNISRLISQNKWGFDELLQVRKGTTVKYYI